MKKPMKSINFSIENDSNNLCKFAKKNLIRIQKCASCFLDFNYKYKVGKDSLYGRLFGETATDSKLYIREVKGIADELNMKVSIIVE